jgi:hypothetical protein
MLRIGYTAAGKGERSNAYKTLVGKLQAKRPLARPNSKWEIILKWILEQNVWGGVDWIYLLRDTNKWMALVNTVIRFLYFMKWEKLEYLSN